MAANYPSNALTFGTLRVDLSDTVKAEDVNSLYREVLAISTDLGAGSMGSGTTGLRYSAAWGVGAFDNTTTSWSGLHARLQNIENGLHRTYNFSVDLQGRSPFNTIQSVDANAVGLSIKTGSVSATSVASADSDGTTIEYISANKFSVGQKVTVTGLGVSTGMSLNVVLQPITAVVGTAPNYTRFQITAPRVEGVTGTASAGETALTIVGNVTGVVAGMTVTGTNIASNTKVSSISGQVVTLDKVTVGTVSGSILFRTIGTSSGTGAATAYQTTSLQRWQKSDGTVVASISPDGNLVAAGTASISGNTTVGGTLTVTGALSISGALTVAVIDGGTP
jgi:hypothetical protein